MNWGDVMGARLYRREKHGLNYSGVAEGDPVTLAGLTGPIDPALVFREPLRRPPTDLALRVALHGLLVHGRDTVSAAALAAACGIKPIDLQGALRRVQGVTGTGEAKYLKVSLRVGKVLVELITKRALRPDRYVQLSVEVLAGAPTTAHARVYTMAAEAASGDHGRRRNVASAPLAALGLDGLPDAVERLQAMADWCCACFATRHFLRAGVDGGRAIIIADSRAVVDGYDHRWAPMPWLVEAEFWRDRFGNLQPYGILDGVHWEGYPLSVSVVRAAKVIEWAARELGAADRPKPPPSWWRAEWLAFLRDAFDGRPADIDGIPVLEIVRIEDADSAFEKFVLAQMESILAGQPLRHEHPNPMSTWAWGERMRRRRVIAADRPDDLRLMTRWRKPFGLADGSLDLTDEEFEAEVIGPAREHMQRQPQEDIDWAIDAMRRQWRVPAPTDGRG